MAAGFAVAIAHRVRRAGDADLHGTAETFSDVGVGHGFFRDLYCFRNFQENYKDQISRRPLFGTGTTN